MNQLDLFTGKQLRDQGIKQAEDHANEAHQNWSDKAYQFLKEFIRHDNVFMAEQVREASKGIVPEPPDLRAWGGVIKRAATSGIIRKKGHAQVTNPKAHAAFASIWEAV